MKFKIRLIRIRPLPHWNLSILSTVFAIRCYQCSSQTDPKGVDKCGAYTKFNKTENIPVECNSDESHMPGSFCMKVVQQGPRGFICKSLYLLWCAWEINYNYFRGWPLETSHKKVCIGCWYRCYRCLQLGCLREWRLLGRMLLRWRCMQQRKSL